MSRPECLEYAPLVVPPPTDTASCVLDLQMQEQQMPEWCWAAVSASLHDMFAQPKSPTAQCGIVNRALLSSQSGDVDACAVPTPESSDKPWYLEFGLDAVSIGRQTIQHAVPVPEVAPRIAAGTPVCVQLSWMRTTQHEHGGGHFVALYGYGPTSDAPKFISIGDPLYGDTVMDVADFPSQYHGGAVWSQTYYVTWPASTASANAEAAS